MDRDELARGQDRVERLRAAVRAEVATMTPEEAAEMFGLLLAVGGTGEGLEALAHDGKRLVAKLAALALADQCRDLAGR
jgi:hypothetical protein